MVGKYSYLDVANAVYFHLDVAVLGPILGQNVINGWVSFQFPSGTSQPKQVWKLYHLTAVVWIIFCLQLRIGCNGGEARNYIIDLNISWIWIFSNNKQNKSNIANMKSFRCAFLCFNAKLKVKEWLLFCSDLFLYFGMSYFINLYVTVSGKYWSNLSFYICDMIKRNESDVGDVVFEILAKTVFKFLCFILFLALSNPS